MRDRTVAWFSQSLITVFAIWIGLGAALFLLLSAAGQRSTYWMLDFTSGYWLVAVLFGFTFDLALDFNSLSASLGVISGEINAGRYDLIRLTLLRPAQFVAKQYAVAQVRAWYATARIIWLRAAFVIFGVFALTLQLLAPGRGSFSTGGGSGSTFDAYPYIMVGIGALVYVLEPLWRMRAVTALGVALSARVFHGISAPLAAGLALIAFLLAQAFIIAGLAFILSFSLVLVLTDEFALVLCFPIMVAFVGGTFYGFYSFLQRVCLRHAAWRLILLVQMD